jgi:hypothetical protein
VDGETAMSAIAAKLHGQALDGSVLRFVALEMADGQLGQADRWLLVADGRASWPVGRHHDKPALLVAFEHLRSACGWLVSAAEHTQ